MQVQSPKQIEPHSVRYFLRLAEKLVDALLRFADAPPSEFQKLLDKLPDEILGAWRELLRQETLPNDSTNALESVLTELLHRRSLTEREPTQDAIVSLMNDIFACVYIFLDEPWQVFSRMPGPQGRRFRRVIMGLFSTALFKPRASKRYATSKITLAEISKRAQKKIASARDRLMRAMEEPSMQYANADQAKNPDTVTSKIAVDEGVIRLERIMTFDSVTPEFYRDEAGQTVPDRIVYAPPVALAGIGDRVHRIWYGTNRAPILPMDEAKGYGNEADVRSHYGYCHVFVPGNHQKGSVGSSWIKRILTWSSDDHLKLDGIFALREDDFRAKLARDLDLWSGQRTGLVFVHGFNVRFDDAALLTAQLGCDLEVNGISSFFSWPSRGGIKAYARDRETIDLPDTVRMFVEFIDMLLSTQNLDRLDIIAHSMGNRLIAKAIEEIQALGSARRAVIGNLVLAAPDVSRVEFKPLAPVYRETVKNRVTLYTCGYDKALWGSGKFNGYERIGSEPPPFCHESVDTVSVSDLRLGFMSHGYVMTSAPVIDDMKQLLWLNQSPAQRKLHQVPSSGVPDYWRLGEV